MKMGNFMHVCLRLSGFTSLSSSTYCSMGTLLCGHLCRMAQTPEATLVAVEQTWISMGSLWTSIIACSCTFWSFSWAIIEEDMSNSTNLCTFSWNVICNYWSNILKRLQKGAICFMLRWWSGFPWIKVSQKIQQLSSMVKVPRKTIKMTKKSALNNSENIYQRFHGHQSNWWGSIIQNGALGSQSIESNWSLTPLY